MRTYELIFIAAPTTSEEDLTKLTSQLEHVIADKGGKVTKTENWGRKKLAYPISKFDEGIYTFIGIEGTGQEIAEAERRLRVSDFVIRHLSVRTDEDLRRAEKLRSRRKTQNVTRPANDDFAPEIDEDDEGFDE
ncbi:MAG TPA: 30S ribosomal protein S6 [Blastocatellia bacterium]|nr:30S ribosomal protein S6 [Blastocatellia bacterium]